MTAAKGLLPVSLIATAAGQVSKQRRSQVQDGTGAERTHVV